MQINIKFSKMNAARETFQGKIIKIQIYILHQLVTRFTRKFLAIMK